MNLAIFDPFPKFEERSFIRSINIVRSGACQVIITSLFQLKLNTVFQKKMKNLKRITHCESEYNSNIL